MRLDFKEFFMKETIVAQATAPGRGGIGILDRKSVVRERVLRSV